MAPRVVWIAQSPTLLNILHRSKQWNMQVATLGDAAGLAELAQMNAPKWDGSPKGVVAVFVCAPGHVEWARANLPDAKLVLVAHQGYVQKLPPAPDGTRVVAFSYRVARFISRSLRQPAPVLTPMYEVRRTWMWSPGLVWTMMSRPQTREAISYAALTDACRLSKKSVEVYGQDQPLGFLSAADKERMRVKCSAYFSALEPRAGFGLAEHEAMSSGCPVIGYAWADMAESYECRPAFVEYGDIYGLAALADRAATDRQWCEERSAEQTAYVSDHYSASHMDDSIVTTLAELDVG